MLFSADVVKLGLEWRRSSDAEKLRLLTVYEVAREFEFTPLRQPVRAFCVLCGKLENSAPVREVCSI